MMTSQEKQLCEYLQDLKLIAFSASGLGLDVAAAIRRVAARYARETKSSANRGVMKKIAKCKDPVSFVELIDVRGVGE